MEENDLIKIKDSFMKINEGFCFVLFGMILLLLLFFYQNNLDIFFKDNISEHLEDVKNLIKYSNYTIIFIIIIGIINIIIGTNKIFK